MRASRSQIKVLLALAHRGCAQCRHEEIQADLADGHQARVADRIAQRLFEQVQVTVAGLWHIQGVDAQRITVACSMGQIAHGRKVCNLDGRNRAMRHTLGPRARAHLQYVAGELRRVQMTMGIDPIFHTGKTL